MSIQTIKLFRLCLPLKEPYYLSYGSVSRLESLFAKIELSNGANGWGESTPLPGYCDSDINSVWESAKSLSADWISRDPEEILANPLIEQDGFLITALWTGLEEATGKIPSVEGTVPLVGIVQEISGESPGEALERVHSLGYRNFKIKVGYKPAKKDKQRIIEFQHALMEGDRIRVDANQSLSEEDAAVLAEVCIPGKVEFFEQPLPVTSWKECALLAKKSPVPIMLDEAITDLESMVKVVEMQAASAVKLKWMKQGGWFYLCKMVEKARKLGLAVVLGNGMASQLNNRHEAIFWLTYLQDFNLAGEMNGFLKVKGDAEGSSLQIQDGCLHFSCVTGKQSEPVIDCVVSHETFRV